MAWLAALLLGVAGGVGALLLMGHADWLRGRGGEITRSQLLIAIGAAAFGALAGALGGLVVGTAALIAVLNAVVGVLLGWRLDRGHRHVAPSEAGPSVTGLGSALAVTSLIAAVVVLTSGAEPSVLAVVLMVLPAALALGAVVLLRERSSQLAGATVLFLLPVALLTAV